MTVCGFLQTTHGPSLLNTSDGLQEFVQNAFNAGSNLEVEVWYDTLTPAPPNPFANSIIGLVVRSRTGAAVAATTSPV